MKIKTNELTGAALDWAVAKCEGKIDRCGEVTRIGNQLLCWEDGERMRYAPSDEWAQGGPIIELEGMDLHRLPNALWVATWWANNSGMAKNPAQRFKHNVQTDGPTLLIAAMRCYVASKLGDEVEVPEELK